MDICEACGGVGTVVTNEAGIVCTACGTAVAQPTLEDDVFGGRPDRDLRVEEDAAQAVDGTQRGNKDRVVQVYISALQSCLLAHVDVVVARGVDPILESVVRQIWLRTLHVSRCLEPGAMHEAGKLFGPLISKLAKPETTEARHKELQADDRFYNHLASFTACLYRFLDRETVIWVLYAALVWIQETVTPLDLSLWIERDVLPYLRLREFQEKAEARFKVYLPVAVFEIWKAPSSLDIEVGAAHLAEDIGLQLPPINVPLYIMRWTAVLELPKEIHRQAIGLYEYHWCGSGCDQESCRQLYYPQLLPVSCILAAMKMSYGLDDAGAAEDHDWMEWTEEQWERHVTPMEKLFPEAERLLKMSGSQLLQFVEYTAASVFPARRLRSCFNPAEKALEKLVKRSRIESPEAQAPQKRRRSTKGAEFWIKKGVTYTSPLYRLPCRMYWFLQSSGAPLICQEWRYPIDFTAVFALFARMANVRPVHLLPCIDSLERSMKILEADCVQWAHGEKREKKGRFTLNPSIEFTATCYALIQMGYSERKAEALCRLEYKQVSRLAAARDSYGPPTKEIAPELAAVMHYHSNEASQSLFGFELRVPRAQVEASELSMDQCEWSESPGELMKQARLACQLQQPLATCQARHDITHALYHSQTWGWDDIAKEEGYESDVVLADEDELSEASEPAAMPPEADHLSKEPSV